MTSRRVSRRLWFESLEDRRLLAAGDLDPSFGAGGTSLVSFGNSDFPRAAALDAVGRIVVGGSFVNDAGKTNFTALRFRPDGSLDPSFSGDGIVATPVTIGKDQAFAVAIQADGKILLGGQGFGAPGAPGGQARDLDYALVRYHPNGSLDRSFGSDGRVLTNLGGINDAIQDIVVQADGKIVVIGTGSGGL